MEGSMAPLQVRGIARRFADPDELAASMPNVAAEYLPLGGGVPFTGGYRRLFLGPLLAQRMEMDAPSIVRGEGRQPGMAGVVIPLDLPATRGASVNGEALRTDDVVLLTGGCEFAWRFDGAAHWLSLVFEDDMLATLASDGRPGAMVRRLRAARGPLAALCAGIDAATRLSGSPEGLGTARAFAGLDLALREQLRAVLASAEPAAAAGRATAAPLRLIRAAEAYLDAHRDTPVYLDQLCAALGVPPRTLSSAFRSVLGVGPIGYLKLRRLLLVRRVLLAGGRDGALVKCAALAHGFWHLGHFARDYRATFGESPSETLEGRLAGRAAFSG